TLTIVTNGVTIMGQTSVPAAPVVTVVQRDSLYYVAWPPVSGVSAYEVAINNSSFGRRVVADTEVLVNDRFQHSAAGSFDVTVRSLDNNVARYRADTLMARSGISGGYGVFGATSTTSKVTVVIP